MSGRHRADLLTIGNAITVTVLAASGLVIVSALIGLARAAIGG